MNRVLIDLRERLDLPFFAKLAASITEILSRWETIWRPLDCTLESKNAVNSRFLKILFDNEDKHCTVPEADFSFGCKRIIEILYHTHFLTVSEITWSM